MVVGLSFVDETGAVHGMVTVLEVKEARLAHCNMSFSRFIQCNHQFAPLICTLAIYCDDTYHSLSSEQRSSEGSSLQVVIGPHVP